MEIPKPAGRGRPRKYPFGSMEVGQSVAFEPKSKREEVLIRRAAYSYAWNNKWKFVIRKLPANMLMVWRVE